MIELTDRQWTRLYQEVLHAAHSMTWTSNPKQAYTQRDRAQEAVQRACLRYLRLRPHFESVDALRRYLVGAARSELGNVVALDESRRELEARAIADDAAITGVAPATTPSPEQLNLAHRQRLVDDRRPDRLVEMLEEKLTEAGDKLGVRVMGCYRRRIDEPERQARELGVSIDEIYNAGKRRRRAMEKVLADYARDVNDPDHDPEKG